MKKIAALYTLGVFLCASSAAAAVVAKGPPSKGWDAAQRSNLPTVQFAAGVNFGEGKLRAAFQLAALPLLTRDERAKALFEKAKETCNIDLVGAIDGITVVSEEPLDPAGSNVYIATHGITPSKLTDCLTKIVRPGKMAVSAPDAHGVVELKTGLGGFRKFYLAISNSGVIVFTGAPNDKKRIDAAVSRNWRLAPALASATQHVDTHATIWAATATHKDIEKLKFSTKTGSASLQCTETACTVQGRFGLESPEKAQAAVGIAKEEIANSKQADLLPKVVETILDAAAARVSAEGSDITASATVTAADVTALISAIARRL